MFPKSGPTTALYHGLFEIEILGKDLGLLLERMYHVTRNVTGTNAGILTHYLCA